MNKLKIILTTFALCIMSVGFAFADEIDSKSTKLKYFISWNNYSVYSNSDFYIADNAVRCYGVSYLYQHGSLVSELSPGVNIGVASIVNNSTFKSNTLGFNDQHPNLDIIPPSIAPTIQGAIQGILPTFSNQLLQFLPKALIMFSMVLLVPLVPRVIRLFF